MRFHPESPRHDLLAWASERFPPTTALLLLVLYLAPFIYGRVVTYRPALTDPVVALAGLVAMWSFFLQLRVIDEHSDYEQDTREHPERALQRGDVTLSDLRYLAGVAFAFQLGLSLWRDNGIGRVAIAWSLAAGWTALIACGFMARSWLANHRLLEDAVHTAVLAFAALWMAQFGAGQRALPGAVAWLAIALFLSALAFELATHPPGDDVAPDGLIVLLLLAATVAVGLALRGIPNVDLRVPCLALAVTVLPALFAFGRNVLVRSQNSVQWLMPAVGSAILCQEAITVSVVLLAKRLA